MNNLAIFVWTAGDVFGLVVLAILLIVAGGLFAWIGILYLCGKIKKWWIRRKP